MTINFIPFTLGRNSRTHAVAFKYSASLKTYLFYGINDVGYETAPLRWDDESDWINIEFDFAQQLSIYAWTRYNVNSKATTYLMERAYTCQKD